MTAWSWVLLFIVFAPVAAWAVIDHLRTPPELGPIQRKPRAYNWEKEQET